jgi:hypothetical protein
VRRGSRKLARILASVALGLSFATGLPSPAQAVDPTELPGDTIGVVVADLDGDGAREVVRIVRESSEMVVVDAWRHGAQGWSPIRGTRIVKDPALSIVALLRTERDGRDRLLGVTAESIQGNDSGATCCLSLVEIGEVGGAIVLTPVIAEDLDGGATSIQTLDMDADGSDELLTVRTTLDDEGVPEAAFFELHAWRGGRYGQVAELGPIDGNTAVIRGESDGLPGTELLVGPDDQGTLHRLAFVDHALRVEEGHVDAPGSNDEFSGWLWGGAGELIVVSGRSGLKLVSWPPGQQPRDVAALRGAVEFPWITAVGTGSEAVLVQLRGAPYGGVGDMSATVYDLGLRPIGEVSMSRESQAIRRLFEQGFDGAAFDVNPYPYAGPLPPELAGGRPSFAAGGVLIASDGEGGFETRPMSPLAGMVPQGTAGPDDAWLAASRGSLYGSADAVYLGAGIVPSVPSGPVVLIPVERLWESSASTAASIELDGAAFDHGGERLLSRPDGFVAAVHAPSGTLVFAGGPRVQAHEVGADPLTVEFTPRSSSVDADTDFEYGVLAVLPDGRVLVEEWEGTVVRERPALEATAATRALELGATIRGSVAPYAALVVDGRQVEVGADGTFEVVVGAAPWPRDIEVVARDPFGNETAVEVEAIGFIDYRELPWLPLVGLGTVLAGAFVFLRVPGQPADSTLAPAGQGTLEEIEAD